MTQFPPQENDELPVQGVLHLSSEVFTTNMFKTIFDEFFIVLSYFTLLNDILGIDFSHLCSGGLISADACPSSLEAGINEPRVIASNYASEIK